MTARGHKSLRHEDYEGTKKLLSKSSYETLEKWIHNVALVLRDWMEVNVHVGRFQVVKVGPVYGSVTLISYWIQEMMARIMGAEHRGPRYFQ